MIANAHKTANLKVREIMGIPHEDQEVKEAARV